MGGRAALRVDRMDLAMVAACICGDDRGNDLFALAPCSRRRSPSVP
jgi:hypothetical protein